VTLKAQVHQSLDDLVPVRDEWDALAVKVARPFAAPAWTLGWWNHLRPPGSRLSVVSVRDGTSLVGLFPLIGRSRAFEPIGGGLAPVEPLCALGEEPAVAAVAAAALAEAEPSPASLELELHDGSPDWTRLLATAWGGGRGASRWTKKAAPVPSVMLTDDYETWMKGRSATFQKEMRRKQRKAEAAGATFRHATPDTLAEDVRVFVELHRRRLSEKGGSSLPEAGMERMLIDVGTELLASRRFRLLCLDVDGRPIAAQLLISAGSEVSAWNTGFDEAYGKLSPLMLCMIHSIARAIEGGERTMSLGPGAQSYKYRLTDEEESLRFDVLVPRGRGYLGARLGLLPAQARHQIGAHLSESAKQRLRSLGRG